jgi:hypothetical protein
MTTTSRVLLWELDVPTCDLDINPRSRREIQIFRELVAFLVLKKCELNDKKPFKLKGSLYLRLTLPSTLSAPNPPSIHPPSTPLCPERHKIPIAANQSPR